MPTQSVKVSVDDTIVPVEAFTAPAVPTPTPTIGRPSAT